MYDFVRMSKAREMCPGVVFDRAKMMYCLYERRTGADVECRRGRAR